MIDSSNAAVVAKTALKAALVALETAVVANMNWWW